MSEQPTPITDAAARDGYTFNREDIREGIDFARDLERQLADARETINMHEKSKSHLPQRESQSSLRRQLADALAQLRIADEQLAITSGALAEVLEILEKFEYEPDEDSCMGMSFFKARLCEDSFFHVKSKLEEALKSPANTPNHPPQVG